MNPLKLKRLLSGKRQIDVFNETKIWPGRLSMIENGLIKPRDDELQLLKKAYEKSPGLLSKLSKKVADERDIADVCQT